MLLLGYSVNEMITLEQNSVELVVNFRLYEGRLKMQMVLIEPFIENGVVTLKHPQHEDVSFKVDDVVKARDARIAT